MSDLFLFERFCILSQKSLIPGDLSKANLNSIGSLTPPFTDPSMEISFERFLCLSNISIMFHLGILHSVYVPNSEKIVKLHEVSSLNRRMLFHFNFASIVLLSDVFVDGLVFGVTLVFDKSCALGRVSL